MIEPKWTDPDPQDLAMYREWLDTWNNADEVATDADIVSIQSFYYESPRGTPTVDDRIWPALWSPGINHDSKQANGLRFAAPLWENAGKPRDYVTGVFSDTAPTWNYTSDGFQHATDAGTGTPIKWQFDTPIDISNGFTVCAWVYQETPASGDLVYYFGLGSNTNSNYPYSIHILDPTLSGGNLWETYYAQDSGNGGGLLHLYETESDNPDYPNAGAYGRWLFVYGRMDYRPNATGGYSWRYSGGVDNSPPEDAEYIFFGGTTGKTIHIKDLRFYDRSLGDGELKQIKDHPSDLYRWDITQTLLDYTVYLPTGGMVMGGAATLSYDHIFTPSGGMVMGGAADITGDYYKYPSGGMRMGGSATVSGGTITKYPSGGMVMGGAATTSRHYYPVPTGGMRMGGAADAVNVVTVSGGMMMGGSATTSMTYNIVPSGGMKMGGGTFANGRTQRKLITDLAEKVTGDLTTFAQGVTVTLDRVSDPDSFIVETASGTELDSYIHYYNDGFLSIYFKCNLVADTDNEFYLYWT